MLLEYLVVSLVVDLTGASEEDNSVMDSIDHTKKCQILVMYLIVKHLG